MNTIPIKCRTNLDGSMNYKFNMRKMTEIIEKNYFVYLRKEPTVDSETRKIRPKTKRRDVVAYSDKECKHFRARWSWFQSNVPTKSNKAVVVNCVIYQVIWLDDLN